MRVGKTFRAIGRVLLLLGLIGFLSIQAHEAGHWMTLEVLGVDPGMGFGGALRFNAEVTEAYRENPEKAVETAFPGRTSLQWAAVYLAGDAVQLALVMVGFLLIRSTAPLFIDRPSWSSSCSTPSGDSSIPSPWSVCGGMNTRPQTSWAFPPWP